MQSTFDAENRRLFFYGTGDVIGDRSLTVNVDSGEVEDSAPAQGIVYPTFDPKDD